MRRAAIVAPIRTAVGKFQGALAPMTAGELGAVILKALVERTGIDPAKTSTTSSSPRATARARRPASPAGRRWRPTSRSRPPATSSTAAAAPACRR